MYIYVKNISICMYSYLYHMLMYLRICEYISTYKTAVAATVNFIWKSLNYGPQVQPLKSHDNLERERTNVSKGSNISSQNFLHLLFSSRQCRLTSPNSPTT